MDKQTSKSDQHTGYLKRAIFTFWAVVSAFMLAWLSIDPFGLGYRVRGEVLAALAAAVFVLAIVLLVQVRRSGASGPLKWFLNLTGIALVTAPAGFILHNLVYGLAIYFFGEGIWGAEGDEPVFFILTVIVAPLLFIAGFLGTAITLALGKLRGSHNGSAAPA